MAAVAVAAVDAFPVAADFVDFMAGAAFDAGRLFAGLLAGGAALSASVGRGADATFAVVADFLLDGFDLAGARGAGAAFAAGGFAAAGAGATADAAFAATSVADGGTAVFDASGVMLSRRSFA